MLIYASDRCKKAHYAAHLCDECSVEFIMPASLDVVMTSWASYKAAVLFQ